MAYSQSKDEKKRFFSDLEHLCESESDTDFNEVLTSSRRQQPLTTSALCSTIAKSTQIKLRARGKPSSSLLPLSKTTPPPPSGVIDLTSPIARSHGTSSNVRTSIDSINVGAEQSRPTVNPKESRKRLKRDHTDIKLVPEEQQIFKNLVFFFVPNDDIAKPRKIRILRAREHGAVWTRDFNLQVTHTIVEGHITFSEAAKAFPGHSIPAGTIVVKSTWLSESITSMSLRDVHQTRFQLLGAPPFAGKGKVSPDDTPSTTQSLQVRSPSTSKPCVKRRTSINLRNCTSNTSVAFEGIVAQVKSGTSISAAISPGQDESFSSAATEASFGIISPPDDLDKRKKISNKNAGFQCMEPNDGKNGGNPNARTISVLQEMATYYDQTGDQWRTTSYRKAISALRKQSTLIATREQALEIPQIGTRLADKVEEIVTTDRLRRLESAKDDPHAKVLQLFMGIYDVGYKQASQWIAQGHRTLADLSVRAKLSQNQLIGIAHYEDFNQRITREEVGQHASIVRRACQAVDKDLEVIVGGSYRRGSPDSGDIDLLITKKNADMSHIRTLLIVHVVPALTKANFLKCALVSSSSTGSGSKWHGVSCLPGSTTWRRIDLLYVPADELGAALLYFTGNDIFNRSMRLLASKKGMRLNQHGLYQDVMRGPGRARVTDGTLLEGRSERRIFEILDVPWREPWERKC